MAQLIRWGILGAANINVDVIPAIKKTGRSEVIVLGSRSLEKAQAQATRFEIPLAVGSYQQVLDNPDVDVVYIPLANHIHAEWTIKALEAGKHVLCEKPLVLTLEEADAVTAAAQRTGKVVMEAFAYLQQPQTKKVRELLQSGIIGDVKVITGTFSFVFENMQDFRWNPAYGGGSLWDIGSYPVSYAYWLQGTPDEVFGHKRLAPGGVDLAFAGQMHYASGVVAQFDCSFDQEFFLDMDIRGTKGRLLVDLDGDPQTTQVIRVYHDGVMEQITVEPANQYVCEVQNMEAAILGEGTPLISLQDSRNLVKILTALHESANLNKPVSI